MGDFTDWKQYNHAWIPTLPPHETPDITEIKNGNIWKSGGVLARWTTDYDCKQETNFWYVIRDIPFDLSLAKSQYKYKINKGIKYFDVRKISPSLYLDEMWQVQEAAFDGYPAKYRPKICKDDFFASLRKICNTDTKVYGAFYRDTGELCGYSIVPICKTCISLQQQKAKPSFEKYQINAALVYAVLEDCKEALRGEYYICDGARNINHETNFQEYLEKYFGFRKAYCKLHIQYKPMFSWIVKIIYPFRRVLAKADFLKPIHLANSILKMEDIYRSDNE